ncbi:hypothetical protein [Crossiella sp. NPDC003009]
MAGWWRWLLAVAPDGTAYPGLESFAEDSALLEPGTHRLRRSGEDPLAPPG